MKSIPITYKSNHSCLNSKDVVQYLILVNRALNNLAEILSDNNRGKFAKKIIIDLAFSKGHLSKLFVGTLKEEMHNSFYARYVN